MSIGRTEWILCKEPTLINESKVGVFTEAPCNELVLNWEAHRMTLLFFRPISGGRNFAPCRGSLEQSKGAVIPFAPDMGFFCRMGDAFNLFLQPPDRKAAKNYISEATLK